jgi:peptide/nickel transport system substrate-binding protein
VHIVSTGGIKVHRIPRLLGAWALTIALVVALGACGSSSKSSSSATATVTNLMGTAPDFLDPGEGYTTQAAEVDWITYTGLLTYAHANGEAGGKVIPGVADALPKISPDGKTYTFTLRKGLVYSNGAAVKAGDFAYSIQRSMKLNWGGKSFFTENIVGAQAFDKGTAKTISGIKADEATGQITIELVAPYGAFSNVLAFPAAALVPTGTAMTNLSNNPPPGVGPYKIVNVVPNQSFSVVKNPNWSKAQIPGIPAGHVNVDVKIVSNTQSEAQQVVSNSADAFDWGDTVPASLLPQIQSQASARYAKVPSELTWYFFLNTKTKPFSSQQAREAVAYAIDRRALSRLDSGFLAPACFFLPVGMIGHPTGSCPFGDPNAAPNLTKAKQLIQESGMAGTSVTLWGQTRQPRREYADYFASVLNSIGLKATEKIIADATYFPTIGNLKLNPQAGVADWQQDFPNPSDFYLLLNAKSIQATNNQNFSQVEDPHIQSELAVLNKVPAADLQSVASRWAALDEYVAKKAYVGVYGYEDVPKFLSTRLNFSAALFNPVYGNDWTTWQLK